MRQKLIFALGRLLDRHFAHLTKPLRKNLALLAAGFISLLSSARSGNGKLTLAALIRVLPLDGSFKKKEKRLTRLLNNSRLEYRSLLCGLAPLLLGGREGFFPPAAGPDQGRGDAGIGGRGALRRPGIAAGLLHLRLSAV